MTKYRDFGSGKNAGEKEPVTFKIHGEDFSCREQLQGKTLLDLVSRSGGEDPAESAKTINMFFEQVLLPESYTRFSALLKSEDKIVTVETLGEISGWLVEVYAGRPEGEPEVS
jgi:hypothetical protein